MFARVAQVLYKSNGDLKRVVLKSSGRRGLAEEEDEKEENIDGADEGAVFENRRLYSCDDCEEAWSVVCDEGVPSVCDLVGYGSPLSSEATASIEVMCRVFGDACSMYGEEAACEGQCEKESDDDGEEGNAVPVEAYSRFPFL